MGAILGSERTEIRVAMIKILILMVVGSMAWIDEDSLAKSPWEDSLENVSDSESPDGLNGPGSEVDAKVWWKQDFEDLGK